MLLWRQVVRKRLNRPLTLAEKVWCPSSTCAQHTIDWCIGLTLFTEDLPLDTRVRVCPREALLNLSSV